eukprot:8666033-Pyramimonas_sp.AAC.1
MLICTGERGERLLNVGTCRECLLDELPPRHLLKVVVADTDKDAGVGALHAVLSELRRAERLRGTDQQQPLLRVNLPHLRLADAKELGVELIDASDERAVPAVQGARRLTVV